MGKDFDKDLLFKDLLNETTEDGFDMDNLEDLERPVNINLEEINDDASNEAGEIASGLSDAFFSQQYIEEHVFVKNKIIQETQNIRRLLKILKINEKAQDVLINNISRTPNKASLFGCLTGMQSTLLSVQKQLSEHQKALENIFAEMQAECEKLYGGNESEIKDDGSMTAKGSRDFITLLKEKLNQNIYNQEL